MLKSNLPENINSVNEARIFYLTLASNGELFHPEDYAENIVWNPEYLPTDAELDQLNFLNERCCHFDGFDGFERCEFALSLVNGEPVVVPGFTEFLLGGLPWKVINETGEPGEFVIVRKDDETIKKFATRDKIEDRLKKRLGWDPYNKNIECRRAFFSYEKLDGSGFLFFPEALVSNDPYFDLTGKYKVKPDSVQRLSCERLFISETDNLTARPTSRDNGTRFIFNGIAYEVDGEIIASYIK
jgi:hypothetical protein